jgi:5,10-methylene-tetrahydrofolate dehydrogenase/methenyl tetrahydrofolate cyclohydrolase
LPDIVITPQKGGVGPLTVCALFENVITAARNSTSK